MRKCDIENVRALCARVIELADLVKYTSYGATIDYNKTTSQLRRTSMDLTRALADLRRSKR